MLFINVDSETFYLNIIADIILFFLSCRINIVRSYNFRKIVKLYILIENCNIDSFISPDVNSLRLDVNYSEEFV